MTWCLMSCLDCFLFFSSITYFEWGWSRAQKPNKKKMQNTKQKTEKRWTLFGKVRIIYFKYKAFWWHAVMLKPLNVYVKRKSFHRKTIFRYNIFQFLLVGTTIQVNELNNNKNNNQNNIFRNKAQREQKKKINEKLRERKIVWTHKCSQHSILIFFSFSEPLNCFCLFHGTKKEVAAAVAALNGTRTVWIRIMTENIHI